MAAAVQPAPDRLSLLSDVAISTPSLRQVLIYSISLAAWVNGSLAASDVGADPAGAATAAVVTAEAYTDSAVGGRLAVSANLSDLGSFPTARTNLGLGTGDFPTFSQVTAQFGNTQVKLQPDTQSAALNLTRVAGNYSTVSFLTYGAGRDAYLSVLPTGVIAITRDGFNDYQNSGGRHLFNGPSDDGTTTVQVSGGVKATAFYGDGSHLTGFGSAAALNADNSANNLPLLNSLGQLATSVLPPLSISQPFPVSSQAAMLALTAQRGDVAVRSDVSKSYILSADDPTTLSNWVELLGAGESPVQSVNGYVGTVILSSADVLPAQTGNSGKFLTTSGTAASWASVTVPTAANPSATIALTAVNGSTGNFMDAGSAPALSQAIAPTWSGLHTFNAGVTLGSSSQLNLPATTATAGQVTSGGSRFVHAYGIHSTYLGVGAGNLTATESSIGENTAIGDSALAALTTGYRNAAVGRNALNAITSGQTNTAIGWGSLATLTNGNSNVAIGAGVLASLTSGNSNIAIGSGAMGSSTSSSSAIAIGTNALQNNSGNLNTAVGSNALNANTSGVNNTAVGGSALKLSTGNFNVAVGESALVATTTGGTNTACGRNAGADNTAGSNNTYLGVNAGGTGGTTNNLSNATLLGSGAVATASNAVILGNASASGGVGGTTAPLDKWDIFGGGLCLSANSSTSTARQRAGLTTAAVDNTDATRKYRVILSAYDTAAREVMRGEANGSASMVGFLGAAAATQQTGGAATAGALYTSTEQAMLNAAYGALRTFGFLN